MNIQCSVGSHTSSGAGGKLVQRPTRGLQAAQLSHQAPPPGRVRLFWPGSTTRTPSRSHCKPDASPSSRPQIMNPGHNQTLQPCQAINIVVVEKVSPNTQSCGSREEIKRNKKACTLLSLSEILAQRAWTSADELNLHTPAGLAAPPRIWIGASASPFAKSSPFDARPFSRGMLSKSHSRAGVRLYLAPCIWPGGRLSTPRNPGVPHSSLVPKRV